MGVTTWGDAFCDNHYYHKKHPTPMEKLEENHAENKEIKAPIKTHDRGLARK